MATPSGASWVAKFPGSHSIDDLEPVFRANVQRFLKALHDAGATVTITATLRPPERAYLMHWSWKIVKEHLDAQHIPPKTGVDIEWWHGTQSASETSAKEMVNGYGIQNLGTPPALDSRHIEGNAVDMHITWASVLRIAKADGSHINIVSTPRDETNPDLIQVGATYGVIHLQPVEKDKVHWSTDGH